MSCLSGGFGAGGVLILFGRMKNRAGEEADFCGRICLPFRGFVCLNVGMKKFLLCVLICFAFSAEYLFCADSLQFVDSLEIEPESYAVKVEGFDFGAAAVALILNLGRTVIAPSVKAEDFEVSVFTRSAKSESSRIKIKGKRKVNEAYISDESGKPSEEKMSRYITLKLSVSPDDELCSPFTGSKLPFFSTESVFGYRIRNDKLKFTIQKSSGIICPQVARFKSDRHTSGEVTISYFSWKPEAKREGDFSSQSVPDDFFPLPDSADSFDADFSDQSSPDSKNARGGDEEKIPLLIWFHGMGESGSNPYLALLGIKAAALIEEEVQSHFKNGCAVLIPQCPTGWLETTETDFTGHRIWAPVDIQGTANKIASPITGFFNNFFYKDKNTSIEPNEAVSYYTAAVKDLIDRYIRENPDVDTKRIYIGGCSAGGYMVINMLFQFPKMFAAAIPVCEVYPDSRISHANIEKIRTIPMWFVAAKTDETVSPEKYTFALVDRLKTAGAENMRATILDSVRDTTGMFFDPEDDSDSPAPYEYAGHWSWIYVFNDDIFDGDLNLFDWLASCRLK